MEKTRLYEIDGMKIEIPLQWDDMSEKYLEVYDHLIENRRRTPLGYPIVTITDDACQHAPEGVSDCWSCPHYKPASEHTWFGSCRNEQNKIQPQKGDKTE